MGTVSHTQDSQRKSRMAAEGRRQQLAANLQTNTAGVSLMKQHLRCDHSCNDTTLSIGVTLKLFSSGMLSHQECNRSHFSFRDSVAQPNSTTSTTVFLYTW